MGNNWVSTPESDVFRIREGEVNPLLRDLDGVLYEPVTPGSMEDPFTFRPKTIGDILYGLNKIKRELEVDNPTLALEIAERCRGAAIILVKEEYERRTGC